MSGATSTPPSGRKQKSRKTTCLIVGLGCLGLALVLSLPVLGLLMYYSEELNDWVNDTWAQRQEQSIESVDDGPNP